MIVPVVVLVLVSSLLSRHVEAKDRLADYVDLLIGTQGATPGSAIAGGNAFPGAALPWGMAKVGIDTSYLGLPDGLAVDCNAGYSPLGNVTAVSMMHVSGTGGNPTYGLVAQMPLTGALQGINLANNNTYAQNRSLADESASIGHFTTTLLNGIQIDITAANHSGVVRYTFPSSSSSSSSSSSTASANGTTTTNDDAHILVDLTHVLPAMNPTTMSYSQQYLRGDLHVRTGAGGQPSYYGSATYTGGWSNPDTHQYFFCANFSLPDGSALVPTNAYAAPVGFDRVDGAGTFSWPYNAFEPATAAPSVRSDTDIKAGGGNRMGTGALFSWTRAAAGGGDAAAVSGVGNTTSVVESRIGISHISVANACGYLEAEVPPTASFADIVEQAKQEWETKVLSTVQVVDDDDNNNATTSTSQNDTLKTMLYTALYQMALMPTDKTGENPAWTSNETFPYYDDHYTLWDTYRTLMPLYHLLFTATYTRVVKGLVNIFTFEGFLPAGRAANYNGRVQGGTHADMVLGDAFSKSVVGGFPSSESAANTGLLGLGELGLDADDWAEAYRAVRRDADVLPERNADSVAFDGATKEGRGALDDYLRLGYITRNHSRSISRGLEYPQNDFAVWALAQGLNASADEQARFRARASWWENQWNAEASASLALGGDNGTNTTFTGFAGPRNADGTFNVTSYDPLVCTPACGWADDIYEAKVWETSFTAAPHDMARVIALMGGDAAFVQRLDASFLPGLAEGKGTGNANNDAGTSLFNPGNEPSFPMPFLYNYVPRNHWKTANQTRAIVDAFYGAGRDGYPGNIDAGALPSWLVFNLLGLYPVAGQPLYLLGAPRFASVRVALFGGTALARTLAIRADGLAADSYYPQRVTLDGVALDRAWVSHAELVGASELVFEMGTEPAAWDSGERPWSLSGW